MGLLDQLKQIRDRLLKGEKILVHSSVRPFFEYGNVKEIWDRGREDGGESAIQSYLWDFSKLVTEPPKWSDLKDGESFLLVTDTRIELYKHTEKDLFHKEPQIRMGDALQWIRDGKPIACCYKLMKCLNSCGNDTSDDGISPYYKITAEEAYRRLVYGDSEYLYIRQVDSGNGKEDHLVLEFHPSPYA